jgi:hypothetical protein
LNRTNNFFSCPIAIRAACCSAGIKKRVNKKNANAELKIVVHYAIGICTTDLAKLWQRWIPTKCFSSLWAKFMPALLGPCQAGWITRLVEFSITPFSRKRGPLFL